MDESRLADLERRLQEVERERQEERQRAEKERQRAEKERQRAEGAERERQEERQRAEKERQRAEKERQRAEGAERERQEERQRAELSERQTKPTTLDEYILACHTAVFSRFFIETDPRLTSKGSITNPRGKWCPTSLRPWSDFLGKRNAVFDTLGDTFPAEARVFENVNFLEGLGARVSRRKIADEKSLEYFLHISVEDPVRTIIDRLKANSATASAFDIGNGIIFENHPHAISDAAEEVVDRETPTTPPQTPNQRHDPRQLRADQICIYRSDDAPSKRTMISVSEYKPPHKLTAPHLRVGLRPMDIYEDVVNRKTIPTSVDPGARFEYFADRLTASAITQTYHYMIEGGLEYGLLTTGEAIVFLMIDWEHPGTLYYHLAEPGPETSSAPSGEQHICTAVGQYLAFTLLALRTGSEHGQDERQNATHSLRSWAEDFETTVRSIPDGERTASSDASYIPGPTTYQDVKRSPIAGRLRRRPPLGKRCDESPAKVDHQSESSDDESSPRPPDTPTPTLGDVRRSGRILARRPRGGGSQEEGKGAGAAEAGAEVAAASWRDRPYCTQKCLLGLVRGRKLDARCPNVGLHRRDGDSHPVKHAEWLGMLRQQLEQSLDNGITPLGHSGARGVLFKVTMLTYGYTVVSKGTVHAFIPDLKHEADVYKRLLPAQGRHVPVFLGTVDLRDMQRIYYYDHRVYVVYMAFLSWGGCSLSEARTARVPKDKLRSLAVRSLRAVHCESVLHKDVRDANMLFNEETGVMMIDFERAEMGDPQRQALAPVIPNKRAWPGKDRQRKQGREVTINRHGFVGEVGELEAIFARNYG